MIIFCSFAFINSAQLPLWITFSAKVLFLQVGMSKYLYSNISPELSLCLSSPWHLNRSHPRRQRFGDFHPCVCVCVWEASCHCVCWEWPDLLFPCRSVKSTANVSASPSAAERCPPRAPTRPRRPRLDPRPTTPPLHRYYIRIATAFCFFPKSEILVLGDYMAALFDFLFG